MANSIIMPKTGMAMEEGVIIEWRVKEGDKIAKGDVVAVIETDKSTMELESDYDGVILAVLGQAGETVPVTQVIAWVGQSGEAVPAAPSGAGTTANTGVSAPAAAQAGGGASGTAVSPGTARPVTADAGGIKATPAARALAKERGIDLAALLAGGKYGEIRRADVEAKVSTGAVSAPPPARHTAEAGTVFAPEDRRVPLTKIQQITGQRMAESRRTKPEVTAHIRADVTRLLEIRQELNEILAAEAKNGGPAAKITINDFVLLAVVKALLSNPRLNSVLDGTDLIYKGDINLGMAAATGRGLVVPVIHRAQNYRLTALSLRAAELAGKAREGKLSPGEMSGGTFTVSNIGMYGITSFTPIINPPEAAILGVCAVEDEFVPDGQRMVNRKKMGLSLAYDHRIADGAESSVFLKQIKDNLEKPLMIML